MIRAMMYRLVLIHTSTSTAAGTNSDSSAGMQIVRPRSAWDDVNPLAHISALDGVVKIYPTVR